MKKWIMVIVCLMVIFIVSCTLMCKASSAITDNFISHNFVENLDTIYKPYGIPNMEDMTDVVRKYLLTNYQGCHDKEIIIIGKDYETYALLSDSVDIEWVNVNDYYHWCNMEDYSVDYNHGYLEAVFLLGRIKVLRNKFDKCCEISEKNNIESFEKKLDGYNITYKRCDNKDYLHIGGNRVDGLNIEANDINKVIKFAEKAVEKRKIWDLNRKNKENLYKNI